jgi:hypothetical protein
MPTVGLAQGVVWCASTTMYGAHSLNRYVGGWVLHTREAKGQTDILFLMGLTCQCQIRIKSSRTRHFS